MLSLAWTELGAASDLASRGLSGPVARLELSGLRGPGPRVWCWCQLLAWPPFPHALSISGGCPRLCIAVSELQEGESGSCRASRGLALGVTHCFRCILSVKTVHRLARYSGLWGKSPPVDGGATKSHCRRVCAQRSEEFLVCVNSLPDANLPLQPHV